MTQPDDNSPGPSRELLEQLLQETEGRFKAMADAAPVLLWMSRTDGLCTFFNQTWLQFTGRSMEQEWGNGWAEGVHFEDFRRCLDTYTDAFHRREVFEMEYRLRRHDGVYRWILDRGSPATCPTGRSPATSAPAPTSPSASSWRPTCARRWGRATSSCRSRRTSCARR